MSNPQTDNTYLQDKISLRLTFLPDKDIKVLDCFAGEGIIWKTIKKNNNKKIEVLSIDKKSGLDNTYLIGDNIKFLKSLNLNEFDIIDLDAYGTPFKQLEIIFDKNYKGHIFCTFIQIRMGSINNDLLYYLGYSKNMLNKVKVLFWKNAEQKLFDYISLRTGVKEIHTIKHNRINYFYFYLDN